MSLTTKVSTGSWICQIEVSTIILTFHHISTGLRYSILRTNETIYNVLSKDLLVENNKAPFNAVTDNGLTRQPAFHIIPFFYWLFIHNAPYDFEEPIGFPCNFRKVNSESLSSIEDQLKMPGRLKDGVLLQDRNIDVFVYSTEANFQDRTTSLESFATFAAHHDDGVYSGCTASVFGLRAVPLQREDCSILAAFLGFQKIDKVEWSNGLFSWNKIFERFSDFEGLGSSVEILNRFLAKIQVPFEYDINSDVGLCNKHFKNYFRSIVNIDMAPIEGGHRTWILCKKMIGHKLDAAVPCHQGIGKFGFTANCSLALKTPLVVCPWKKGQIFDSTNLAMFSKGLQENRDRLFSTSWILFLQDIYRLCLTKVADMQITYKELLRMNFDSETRFTELIKTIKSVVVEACINSPLIQSELTSCSEEAKQQIRQSLVHEKSPRSSKILKHVSNGMGHISISNSATTYLLQSETFKG